MKKILFSILGCLMLSAISAKAQVAVSGSFQITVNGASCTTASPCTMQLYRAVATAADISASSCPALSTAGIYTEIAPAVAGTTITSSSTQWVYSDPLTSVNAGAGYCYAATLTYTAGGGPSGSIAMLVTVPFPIPSVPTSLSGTWIPGL